MLSLKRFGTLWIFVFSLLLQACASSPYSQEGKARSDALLEAQISQARLQLQDDNEPRIIYVGAALHSQSRAFREDVVLTESIVKKIDSKSVSIKLGNPAFGQDSDWPYATKESLAAALSRVAQIARPKDKVIVMVSSHGNVGSLAVNAGNQSFASVNGADLAEALSPISRWPTLVIVSACFSGSLIDTIKADNRVILTAAAKNRSSFGCNFYSKNTFFIEELFGSHWNPSESLHKNFLTAKSRVRMREKKLNIGPPSEPQYYAGSSIWTLAETSLSDWRTTEVATKK